MKKPNVGEVVLGANYRWYAQSSRNARRGSSLVRARAASPSNIRVARRAAVEYDHGGVVGHRASKASGEVSTVRIGTSNTAAEPLIAHLSRLIHFLGARRRMR